MHHSSVWPGAHNDSEEKEGKGRSVNRPRGRLNFLTVVVLLILGIDDASQRMYAHVHDIALEFYRIGGHIIALLPFWLRSQARRNF